MSALLPIFPGDLERWARPRPEPVALVPPAGWAPDRVFEPDTTFPNQRIVWWKRGAASIELFRYWDRPRSPGYPMVEASRSPVVVAGRDVELIATSMWNGIAGKRVELCWLTGEGYGVTYGVRLSFDGCTPAEVAQTLATVTIAW